jgi:hypothetical protein
MLWISPSSYRVTNCSIYLHMNQTYAFGSEVLGSWFDEHFWIVVEGGYFVFLGSDGHAFVIGCLSLLFFLGSLPFANQAVDFRVEFLVDLDHEVHTEIKCSAHMPAVQTLHFFLWSTFDDTIVAEVAPEDIFHRRLLGFVALFRWLVLIGEFQRLLFPSRKSIHQVP